MKYCMNSYQVILPFYIDKQLTFSGKAFATLDGIFVRRSSRGVNGAVVSAITSNTL